MLQTWLTWVWLNNKVLVFSERYSAGEGPHRNQRNQHGSKEKITEQDGGLKELKEGTKFREVSHRYQIYLRHPMPRLCRMWSCSAYKRHLCSIIYRISTIHIFKEFSTIRSRINFRQEFEEERRFLKETSPLDFFLLRIMILDTLTFTFGELHYSRNMMEVNMHFTFTMHFSHYISKWMWVIKLLIQLLCMCLIDSPSIRFV